MRIALRAGRNEEMKEIYVFFSANYFPHIGGVERYTYGLTRELIKHGKDVAIITSSIKNEPRYTEDSDGAKIYRVPSTYVLGDRMPLMFPGRGLRRLKDVFEGYDQIRVIIQTMLYPLSLWALGFAKKNKYPCIVISHGVNYVCQGHSPLDWIERKYENFMLRQARSQHADFFAVSKSGGEWLNAFQITSHGVLYNSVDYLEIRNICEDSLGEIRKKFEISEDTTVFSFAGRIIPEKGIFQLVDAFSQLVSEGWDIRLLIVGDGPKLNVLKAEKKDRIVYFGYKPHHETIRILKASDCFCLPSNSEGMPTVIMEAALCGNYIITSPYGGGSEIIASEQYGYVMDGNSKDDVYQAMKYFLEHRENCNRAADLCQQNFFKGGFTWRDTCSRLVSYFDEKQK